LTADIKHQSRSSDRRQGLLENAFTFRGIHADQTFLCDALHFVDFVIVHWRSARLATVLTISERGEFNPKGGNVIMTEWQI
jgi:hypothetical protein